MATTTTKTINRATVQAYEIVTNAGEFSDIIVTEGAKAVTIQSDSAGVKLRFPTLVSGVWTGGASAPFGEAGDIVNPTATTAGYIPGDAMPPRIQIEGVGTNTSVIVIVHWDGYRPVTG